MSELSEMLDIIYQDEQIKFLGGNNDDGTNNDGITWVSQDDLYNWEGNWPGGWVEGLGYVSADNDIIGYHTVIYDYSSIYFTPDFQEGIGATSIYSVNADVNVSNGIFTIGASGIVHNGYNIMGAIHVYVDGNKVYSQQLDTSGTIVYQTNTIPIGTASVDLTQYHGHVQIKLTTVSFQTSFSSGYSGSLERNMIVYDAYR